MKNKEQLIKKILEKNQIDESIEEESAEASVNFAIIKYWGKENSELMIPQTGSLAIKPKKFLGTKVVIRKNNINNLTINNINFEKNSDEFQKCFSFVNLFKLPFNLKIETINNVNTANGLASSSSAFAAITECILKFFKTEVKQKERTMLARLGSVSASRSIINSNLIELVKDEEFSFSKPIDNNLDFNIGLYISSKDKKYISSRKAMEISYGNKKIYNTWAQKNEQDLINMKYLISRNDIKEIHKLIIENSKSLNKLMKDTGINYDNDESIFVKDKIEDLNKNGYSISFTQDAGSNIKIISEDKEIILKHFKNVSIF